jgi:hypothetical protein
MKKFFFWFLVGIVLLELILQLGAPFFSTHGSFESFVPEIKQRIKEAGGDKVIYFVGDSTIFGIGSSNPDKYSLPPQLERLMQVEFPHFHCVNTGYAGTSTADHLRVFALLPPGATVIYRGGSADTWVPPGGHLRFMLWGHLIEFRVLKMLYLLAGGFFFPNVDYENSLSAELQKTVKDRELRVFLLDYSTYPQERFSALFIKNNHLFQRIPLHDYLREHGYLRPDGFLAEEYIGMTGTHPNDSGYFLEALFIYNHFCASSLFGLTPDKQRDADNLRDEVLNSMQARLEYLLKKISGFNVSSLQVKGAAATVGDMIYEAWNICNSLVKSGQTEYAEQAGQLGRLSLLVFHDVRVGHDIIGHVSAGRQSSRIFADQQASLYYLLMKAVEEENSASWGLINRTLVFTDSSRIGRKITYLGKLAPYPMELCPVFIRESGFSAAELSVRKEWESFFSFSYTDFGKKAVCE